MAPKTMSIVVDYQNVHLTGRDKFVPLGIGAADCLVHPGLLADRIAARWTTDTGDVVDVRRVLVYRGAPSQSKNPEMYAATQRQQSEWTKDRRVEVVYRTLRYPHRPTEPPREKGIDVLVALNLVKLAKAEDDDVVVLVCHDTDQLPALEMALIEGVAEVATAGWERGKKLNVPGHSKRHLTLTGDDFVRSRDRRQYYSAPPPKTL